MTLHLPTLPKIRSVSPLLFGLAVCVTSGCISSGANRSVNLSDRSASNQRATAKAAAVDRSEPEGKVSFRAPERSSAAASEPEMQDQSFTGHSADLETIGQAARDSRIVNAGHQIDPAATDEQGDSWQNSSRVVDAHYRSDRDASENPIQLQGLQAVEPERDSVDGEQFARTWQPETTLTANGSNLESQFQPDSSFPVHTHATAHAGTWQSDLEHLIARAEREWPTRPGNDPDLRAEYRRQQVQLRLLYLLANHPEQALTAIPSLDSADQEYWQKLIWAVTDSLDADPQLTDRERAAQAIPSLNEALRRLREQADLTIRNSAFCEEISYFGNYKRFPREEFVPGQPVLLYAEIENFRSEPSQTGEYRTLLRSLIEIVGPNGQTRWKKSFAATEDICRNPRRDYFHNYQFTIPERLPLGPHTLKLTVVDELSGKQTTSMIKFMVK